MGNGGADEEASTDDDASHHQSSSWSDILRPILNVVVPCLNCQCHPFYYLFLQYYSSNPTSTLTGTIICPIGTNTRVRLCIQRTPQSPLPVLLELPLRTSEFAGLVQLGSTRMVFTGSEPSRHVWVMLCNGKSIGIVRRKEVVEKDKELLRMINAVSTGAGILPFGDGSSCRIRYLRGQFERTGGPDDSVVYHLVDPSGSLGQDLSFCFVRHYP